MPVAIEGVQQKPFDNFTPAPRANFHCAVIVVVVVRYAGVVAVLLLVVGPVRGGRAAVGVGRVLVVVVGY